MPYRISTKGITEFNELQQNRKSLISSLTDYERKALDYLSQVWIDRPDYVMSSEIARHYNLAPQAMRGPCYQLFKLGLLDKQD